jgi:hypothetical protein
MKKKKVVRLSNNANEAFKILDDTSYKQRIVKLENVNELSFALLIYWNRIELALKLGWYYQKIEEAFPIKLDFIDKRTSFIKSIYSNNPKCYDCIMEGTNSVWKLRNKIAHASYQISRLDYEKYKEQIIAFEKIVRSLIPERNSYLTKKKGIKINN